MNRRIIVLMVFVLSAISATAGEYRAVNPVEGYVVTLKGDTIRGTIDYLSEKKCATMCMFKADGETAFRQYTTDSLAGYRMLNNGVYYVRRTLPVDGQPKAFFAEFLLQGGVSLYHYYSGRQHYYFLEDEDGKVAQLRDIDLDALIDKSTSGRARAKSKEIYAASQMLKQSTAAVKELQRRVITGHNLTAIVRQYDEEFCTSSGPCVQYRYDEKASAVAKLRLRIEGGVGRWNMYDSPYAYKSWCPEIGIGADLDFPRNARRFSIQALAMFSLHNHLFEGYAKKQQFVNENGQLKVIGTKLLNRRMKYGIVKIELGATHRIGFGGGSKGRLLLRWGLAPGFVIGYSNQLLDETSPNGIAPSSRYEENDMKSALLPVGGFIGAVGFELPVGRHFMNITFTASNCLGDAHYLPKMSAYDVRLGFLF